MASAPEQFSNIQIDDEIENNTNKLIDNSTTEKNESISISICSEKTCDISTNDGKKLRKKFMKTVPNSLSLNILFPIKKELYIEDEFFLSKKESALEIFSIPKKENEKQNEKTKEIVTVKTSNEDSKNSIIENKKIKITAEEETKNNKINQKNIVKDEITNGNIICDKNKNLKKDNYSQIIDMKIFNEKPPKVSRLFLHDYDYQSKNVFSHLNDTVGVVNESKKIANVFYDHLLIKNEKDYIHVSSNKRNNEKLLTVIYYSH